VVGLWGFWGVTPEKFRNFRWKFLLSGALSVRKLIHVEVQNTVHLHSRLYSVHPARCDTKNGQLASGPGLRWDAWQRGRKTGSPGKHGMGATLCDWNRCMCVHDV